MGGDEIEREKAGAGESEFESRSSLKCSQSSGKLIM